MKLIIASNNKSKIREYTGLFKIFPNIITMSLKDFPDYTPDEETGETLEENAIHKAEHAAEALGEWVIADDSGISVPALNGDPGIYSARYSGVNATDRKNNIKLLSAMKDFENFERSAAFECCIALAMPQGTLKKCVTGRCEGTICAEEHGGNGFGYDPIFIMHNHKRTFAELDETTKNRISHRSKAFEKILMVIEALRL